MRQMGMRKFAIAISTVAFAAMFSVGWSEQRGISLSVRVLRRGRGSMYTPTNIIHIELTSLVSLGTQCGPTMQAVLGVRSARTLGSARPVGLGWFLELLQWLA